MVIRSARQGLNPRGTARKGPLPRTEREGEVLHSKASAACIISGPGMMLIWDHVDAGPPSHYWGDGGRPPMAVWTTWSRNRGWRGPCDVWFWTARSKNRGWVTGLMKSLDRAVQASDTL